MGLAFSIVGIVSSDGDEVFRWEVSVFTDSKHQSEPEA